MNVHSLYRCNIEFNLSYPIIASWRSLLSGNANFLFNLNEDYLSLIKYALCNETIYPLIRWHTNNLNILFEVEKQLVLGYIFETLHATSYYYCLQSQKKCRAL